MRNYSSRAAMVTLASLGLTASVMAGVATSHLGALDPADPTAVYTVTFTLSKPGPVIIQSYGYGGSANARGGKNAEGGVITPGGFDPYISVFQGSGSSATFVASNDDGPCPPATAAPVCRDSNLTLELQTGTYTVALSAFENMSFAENRGAGALGDGFIGIATYYDLGSQTERTPNYAFDIKIPTLISQQVSVSQSGFVRSRSGLWTSTITVTNNSGEVIPGPIQVVVTNLSANATLVGPTGTLLGKPYITVTDAALGPGASASASIQFTNPTNGYIMFTPVSYSGLL